MTPPPTAYSMLLGRFVFCVVSIAVAPSLVMPAKSLAADKKVDCGKILTEIESGMSAQEVAKNDGHLDVKCLSMREESDHVNPISFEFPDRYTHPIGPLALE